MERITWTLESKKAYELDVYKERLVTWKSKKELHLDSGEFGIWDIENLAKIYAFEGDIIKSKIFFYKHTRLAIEFYHIYLENRYPNLKKDGVPPATFVGSVLSTILCDNTDIFQEYAHIIECYEDPNKISETRYHFFWAFKYLFLNEFGKSKEHYLKGIHQEKTFNIHLKSFSFILKGVLEKNVDWINEGLAYAIKYHKRENPKGSLFHAYSIEATALAKLAMMYGLQPDVSSSFIHKGLLEKTEGIAYEGIEEITDALEEANRRAGGFRAKISSWFKP